MVPLAVFGYGQGMVLAPLFSAVLTQVRHTHAGSGAGILTTTQQVANGTESWWWVRFTLPSKAWMAIGGRCWLR